MKTILSFVAGFVLALALAFGFFRIAKDWSPRTIPDQISFDSVVWRESDSGVRGKMYKDLIKKLEHDRPTKDQAIQLLGLSGSSKKAYLNGAEYYLIYQIDLGQRMSGMPYLDKIGIAFEKDGRYSHIAIWD